MNSALIAEPGALSPITNPGAAALQAVMIFFDERRILSGDESFSHSAKKPEFGKMNGLCFSMFGFL